MNETTITKEQVDSPLETALPKNYYDVKIITDDTTIHYGLSVAEIYLAGVEREFYGKSRIKDGIAYTEDLNLYNSFIAGVKKRVAPHEVLVLPEIVHYSTAGENPVKDYPVWEENM